MVVKYTKILAMFQINEIIPESECYRISFEHTNKGMLITDSSQAFNIIFSAILVTIQKNPVLQLVLFQKFCM